MTPPQSANPNPMSVETRGDIRLGNIVNNSAPVTVGGISIVNYYTVVGGEGADDRLRRICRVFVNRGDALAQQLVEPLEAQHRFQMMPPDNPMIQMPDLQWVRKLALLLGQCNGAILFVDAASVDEPRTVIAAWFVRWLRWMLAKHGEPDLTLFRPLFVLLDDGAWDAIQMPDNPLHFLAGDDWQTTILRQSQVPDLAAAIASHFQETYPGRMPLGYLESYIQKILQGEEFLDARARAETLVKILQRRTQTFLPGQMVIGLLRQADPEASWRQTLIDLCGYPPDWAAPVNIDDTISGLLTQEIMFQGLDVFRIRELALGTLYYEKRLSLMRLLAPLSINPYFAAVLPFIIEQGPADRHVVCLRASTQKTVELHLLLSYYMPTARYGFILKSEMYITDPEHIFDHRDDWLIIHATRGGSHDDVAETHSEIEDGLKRIYRHQLAGRAVSAHLNDLINRDALPHIIVVLPTSIDDEGFLDELCDVWPLCRAFTFIFFGMDCEPPAAHLFDQTDAIKREDDVIQMLHDFNCDLMRNKHS